MDSLDTLAVSDDDTYPTLLLLHVLSLAPSSPSIPFFLLPLSFHSLKVLGQVDEFNSAIKAVVRDVIFDRDIVVSVFETNIRVLG